MNMQNQIADIIVRFFDNQEWQYNYSEENGLFESGVQLDNEPGGAMIHCIVGGGAFTVMVAPEIAIEEDAFDDVKDFITAANARLMIGCLVLDCEEHVLYFRVGQNCAGLLPNDTIVEDAFMFPITFIDELCPVLLELLAGTISPEDALAQVFSDDEEE
ncbi:MAG: hypothetical protein IJN11_06550 [Oscillospiraceae bacterium]|nr:hypothetical protein [Ruminococcus sp.]MBQ7013556.1 hypothetical protein [Oscillospiraceae bacterium]